MVVLVEGPGNPHATPSPSYWWKLSYKGQYLIFIIKPPDLKGAENLSGSILDRSLDTCLICFLYIVTLKVLENEVVLEKVKFANRTYGNHHCTCTNKKIGGAKIILYCQNGKSFSLLERIKIVNKFRPTYKNIPIFSNSVADCWQGKHKPKRNEKPDYDGGN